MWVVASSTDDRACIDPAAMIAAATVNAVDRDHVRVHAAFALQHDAGRVHGIEDKLICPPGRVK